MQGKWISEEFASKKDNFVLLYTNNEIISLTICDVEKEYAKHVKIANHSFP